MIGDVDEWENTFEYDRTQVCEGGEVVEYYLQNEIIAFRQFGSDVSNHSKYGWFGTIFGME
jgi:hypothetical protein